MGASLKRLTFDRRTPQFAEKSLVGLSLRGFFFAVPGTGVSSDEGALSFPKGRRGNLSQSYVVVLGSDTGVSIPTKPPG